MIKIITSLFLVLCISLVVIGKTSSDSTSSLNLESSQPLLHLWVVADQVAPVRDGPPTGFFRRAGKVVTKTTPEEQYLISNSKTLPFLFSTQTWVELKSDSGTSQPIGWVYWGEEQVPDKSENFTLESVVNN